MAERTERTKTTSSRRRKKKAELNYTFLVVTLALLAYGLVMVFSASSGVAHNNNLGASYYFIRQLIFAAVGVVVMLAISKMDYKKFYNRGIVFLGAGITLLLLVLVLVIGKEGGGATRWIGFGSVRIQPSEIAKFVTVVVMAKWLSDYKGDMKKYSSLIKLLIPAVIFAGMVLLGDHLSGAIIVGMVGVILVYAAGAKASHIIYSMLAVVPVLALAVILQPYRLKRITSFINPFADIRGDGWQVVQSLYSIGSGGLFGVGLGQSRQKHGFLPEPYTDFIFSVICEELGFFGALLVIALFVVLVVTGFKIALNAPDRFSSLLACGMVSLIALQFVLNIAVVTSAMPCTGITLPFFSYGGSALVVNLAEAGVILSVSRGIDRKI